MTPGKFLELVSDNTGIPLVIVKRMDRVLVERGLRVPFGRGLYSSDITPQNAVHLLTILLANEARKSSYQDFTDFLSANSESGETFEDAAIRILNSDRRFSFVMFRPVRLIEISTHAESLAFRVDPERYVGSWARYETLELSWVRQAFNVSIAVDRAEKTRIAKIASLKKQLADLESQDG